MKLDIAMSNGTACISAEWLHELTIWEQECDYTDDCLPAIAPLLISPQPVRPPPTIAALDIGPIWKKRPLADMV